MDYESFKEKFVEDLKDRLDEQGADVKVMCITLAGYGMQTYRSMKHIPTEVCRTYLQKYATHTLIILRSSSL